MATSTEIKQRANTLADKTDVNSITPKEVGGIMYDLASHGENVLRNGGTLGIRKVYESVAAMEADSTNPKDFWGDPIKKGNLVVIYDGTTTGVDNNKIYAFMKPGWELATKLDAAYATRTELIELAAATSASIADLDNSKADKEETDAKISELAAEVIYDVSANNDGTTFSSLFVLLSSENLSTLIPTAVRCGGMSIRFVQSSDNKYVQYRLMAQNFSTTVSDWQKQGAEVSVLQNRRTNVGDAESLVVGDSAFNIKDSNVDALRQKKILAPKLIPNTYINIYGVETAYNGWSSTDYIVIADVEELIATGANELYSCWYDKDKVFISSFHTNPNPPANAVFMRISNDNANMENLSIAVTYWRTDTKIDYPSILKINGIDYPLGFISIGTGLSLSVINVDFDNNKVVTDLSYGYLIDGSFDWLSIVNTETLIYNSTLDYGIYVIYFNYSDNKIYCKRLPNVPKKASISVLGSFTYYLVGGKETVGSVNLNFDKDILRINGRKYTKVFGKKVSFIGDSITTYEGYIPSGHSAVYPTELSGAGIDSVDKTWWMQFIKNTGLKLDVNESWSGTRISTSGPSGYPESSFNADSRVNNLGTPDYIFVCGGTNDFYQNQYGTDLGEFNTTNTTFDTTKFKQALQSLLYKLQLKYPNAKIYIWTPPLRKNKYVFANNENGWCVIDMNKAIKESADFYGARVIDVYKAMTLGRVNNETSSIYDTVHPNELGMKLIADYVTDEFLKEV